MFDVIGILDKKSMKKNSKYFEYMVKFMWIPNGISGIKLLENKLIKLCFYATLLPNNVTYYTDASKNKVLSERILDKRGHDNDIRGNNKKGTKRR